MSEPKHFSPYNPINPPTLTPKEYEQQVVEWLRAASGNLDNFKISHLEHLSGPGGDYEFDAVAKFRIFQGAEIRIIIECKRYSSPVEREKLLALWAKKQDVKADKAMMFATCGFQSGAIKYAQNYGIATISFIEGSFLYNTRSADCTPVPPPWACLPPYAGMLVQSEGECINCKTFDIDHTEPLSKWLVS